MTVSKFVPNSLSMSFFILIVAFGWILPEVSLAQEAPSMESQPMTDSRLFHITLVTASRSESGNGAADLPESIREALEDIQGFLPYKGFEILDTAMIRSSGHARVKLRGPGGMEFTAQMTFAKDSESGEYVVERFAVVRIDEPTDDGQPLGPGVAPPAPDSPMTTSFRIRPGQTVLVGSSRIHGGDQALVVLVSAAP